MKPNTPLFEAYRPAVWSDVVGQDRAVAAVRQIIDTSGAGGKAFWISGSSGTGKSTIAKLIAREIADDFWIESMDSSELTQGRLNDIDRTWRMYGGGRGGKAYIIEEAHGLTGAMARWLNVMIEQPMPSHVVLVFTTTATGQEELIEGIHDATPLISRCHPIDLARRDLAKPFAERLRFICEQAGLFVPSLDRAIRCAKDCRNNLRMMIGEAVTHKLAS